MLLNPYKFRMFIKEMVCKVYDTFLYAHIHPYAALRKMAHASTVEFILKNCPKAIACRTPKKLLDIALRRVNVKGAYFEFGVFTGGSITYIADCQPNDIIHGFDSFEGLPESWNHYDKGAFSLDGQLPKVPDNVKLHKGCFAQTLPVWTKENKDKVAFLHIDCDLYSSTMTIFEYLWHRLQAGSVLVFDDYFNVPNWQADGHKAFHEFIQQKPIEFEYIGYAYKELAVQVTKI